jgi:hypothetical protein
MPTPARSVAIPVAIYRQQLAHVYFEDEPDGDSAAKLLTNDEARHIAVNIAKLPARIANSLLVICLSWLTNG